MIDFDKIFAEYDNNGNGQPVEKRIGPHTLCTLIDYVDEKMAGTLNEKSTFFLVWYAFKFGYVSAVHSMKYQKRKGGRKATAS